MLGVKICSNLALQVWISGQSLYVKDGVWLCGHSMYQNTNVKHSSCRTINFFFNCYTHILYVIIKQFKSANGWFAIFLLHGTLKVHPKKCLLCKSYKTFCAMWRKSAVLMVRLWFHTQMHKWVTNAQLWKHRLKALNSLPHQVRFGVASATLQVGSPTVPVLCQKIIAGI